MIYHSLMIKNVMSIKCSDKILSITSKAGKSEIIFDEVFKIYHEV